jgi:NADP-dependent 3-hydroxy acid dehydrogenase YdfG
MGKITLKPVDQQVAVIFGASSGIGRATALAMAQKGAEVVVAARNEDGLQSLVHEIRSCGREASYVVADATQFRANRECGAFRIEKYGRIDTWIHTAAAAMYATFEDTTPKSSSALSMSHSPAPRGARWRRCRISKKAAVR